MIAAIAIRPARVTLVAASWASVAILTLILAALVPTDPGSPSLSGSAANYAYDSSAAIASGEIPHYESPATPSGRSVLSPAPPPPSPQGE